MEKRNVLQLVLNEIKKDYNDPTILPCKFVILDFDTSLNNVKLLKDVALEGGKTLLNKPIVAKYHQVSQANADDDNFGSHEEYMSKDKHGNDVLVRDTVALGVFTSEGYLEEVNIDGQFKEVMVADGVLWYSKYKDACDLLLDWHERGIKINSSCEYLYKNYSFIDGIEHHHSPIIFESHAILASENRGSHEEVIPAYESATLLSLNELQEFNTLVAQAVNAAKEETTVQENLENEVLETFVEQSNESTEDASNEVTEIEETPIEEVEVIETVEWETVANELQTKLDEMTAKFNELEEKFNTASETIVSLNSQVDELKPYREQFMSTQREKLLEEKSNHFSAKFEAIGAKEQFESEEVQSLIAQSIEETEAGKDALLALNTMIVDLIQEKQSAIPEQVQFIGLASHRKDLVNNEDSFESRYKIK